MPRFAANLSMLYPQHDFVSRFAAAARDGFRAVEYLFPYAHDARLLARQLADHGLQQVLFNAPPGDFDGGERGIAALPGREAEFRGAVAQALDYAHTLACPRVHIMAGLAPAGAERAALRATYLANLAWAAGQAASAGVKLLIEPINRFDIPGFYLNTTAQALSILDEVGAANAYVQYDIYHAQRMEGELAATIARHLPRIAHIQLADNPGRHEPGSGEIHYPWLLRHIDGLGYAGWIGCEYKPAGLTRAGLGWLAQFTE